MKAINTNAAPSAIGPYSQAIQAANTLYVSGQIPIVPETGEIISGGIKEQTAQVIKNLFAIVNAVTSVENIVKTTIYITDMKNFADVNEVYAQFFNETKPARATLGVNELPKGALVEIEAIAIIR